MSRRNKLLIISFVLLLGPTACSKPPANPANSGGPATAGPSPAKLGLVTSLNFVKASAAAAEIPAGGSGEAVVTVAVQQGYHVNANPATDAYLIATEIIVQPGDGLSVGFVKYPTAATRKFAFSDKALAVYEGEVPIKVMLKAARSITKGKHTLPARLNVQACDDQLCYPPGTLELSLPVVVK